MDQLLSLFPNSRFHRHQVSNEPCFRNNTCTKQYLPGSLFGPYSFINVSCGRQETDSVNGSCKNVVEAAVVVKIVHKLFHEWITSKEKLCVVILSPYASQVGTIQEKVRQRYVKFDGFSLKVNLLDEFKGDEADIIILSTVKSTVDASVGWISNPDQINVAFTSARHSLWIVGNGRTLSESDSIWKLIVDDSKHRNCFHDAEEDKDLAKLMLEVKIEFKQLDDLLNTSSMVFQNARWKVYFSANFKESVQKLKSHEMKKLVFYLLVKLAGGWRPKKRRAVSFCDSSLELLKQFKVQNLYVIVSVDIMKDSCYSQVLKIWDILPLEHVPDLINRLNSVFEAYTDEYLSRCKAICIEGDLQVPMIWTSPVACYESNCTSEPGRNSCAYSSLEAKVIEHCKVSESVQLMKFYALSTNVINHMLSGCDGTEVDYPFEVTEQEKEIILRHGSCFVLGRSGTGKTTVVVMKLFQRQQLRHIASEGLHEVESSSNVNAVNQRNSNGECETENKNDILRQVFVTVSARLCHVVKKHISGLTRYTCGWNNAEDSTEIDEYDIDEASLFSDIPDSFIDLPPDVYPLVLTFHKFLMMLDGTIGTSFFEKFPEVRNHSTQGRKTSKSLSLQTFIRTKKVTYTRFCSSYWPHFNMNLTKHLDPTIVFKEIVSYIKGGCQEGLALDGLLSREGYVKLCENRRSMLNEQEREMIYDIFVKYEQQKTKSGEFDLADLVIDLHCRLMNVRYEGDVMDFVYIDEVQDMTMRQISLFKYICKNIGEGFFFTGDTAQAIADGVEFRFEDIRSLFYREFMQIPLGSEAHGMKGKGLMADILCLSQNFRSHVGILKLAQSVIDILLDYFPSSIDRLSPETSLISGDSPVLIETSNDEDIMSLFKGSYSFESSDQHFVGFGAEQAILVRDEAVKSKILESIGKKALVLTILECKGLEFEDVLLYNFFSTSPMSNRWRLLYGYMEEHNLLYPTFRGSFPSFSEGKHMILCSELKQLYVAITRTRQRLWIVEDDNALNPMIEYWMKLHIVEVRRLDNALIQDMQASSSKEAWNSRGLKFFHLQNYATARICFEKAGEDKWVRWAEAAGWRSAADCTRLSPSDCDGLTKAAQIYESIGKHEFAAECFLDMKQYEKAGTIFLNYFGDTKLQETAECFHLAKLYEREAEIYARCGLFSKCLLVCAEAELFNLGWSYFQRWKENGRLREGDIHYFLERGAHYFCRIKGYASMMKFVKSFQSEDQMRSFLDELLILEKERGNFEQAANVARQQCYVLEEADLRERAGQLKEACMVILSHVFTNSLWQPGSKGCPLKSFAKKDELLTKAKTLAKEVSSSFFHKVCAEANALSYTKDNLPCLKQLLADSSKQYSIRGEIICSWEIINAYLHSCSSQENILVGDLLRYSKNSILWKDVSIENLLYSWNLWKGEIEKVCESLQDMQGEEDDYRLFCLDYFGLRNTKLAFVLIYPEMPWTKELGFHNANRSGDSVGSNRFIRAAHRYWSSEIISTSLRLLDELEGLFWFSVNNALPVYGQRMLLVHMFNVSTYLLKSEVVDHYLFEDKLLRVLEVSTEHFIANAFPLEWQKLSAQDVTLLREMNICREIFEKAASVLSSKPVLTHEEVGKLPTCRLSNILPVDIYEQIAILLEKCSLQVESMKCSEQNQELQFTLNYISTNSRRAPRYGLLVRSLSGILMDYQSFMNFRTCDYMSPISFLHIVERL